MNLYYKVEAAFDGMADALKAAMNVAEDSEETELYSDLADDLADLRDDTQSLYEKLIQKKNAAPAAGTAETAKESDKHSDLSIAELAENVKYPYLIVEGAPDGIITTMNNLDGEIFLQLYGAVVETVYAAAIRAKAPTSELVKVERDGKQRAFFRVLKEEF